MKRGKDALRAPGIALLLIWACFSLFALLTRAGEQAALRRQTKLTSEQLVIRIQAHIDHYLSRFKPLELLWLRRQINTEASFREFAGAQKQTVHGLIALNWIDAKGVIRWVVPKDSNQAAQDRDLTKHPIAGAILANAAKDHRLGVTPLLLLYQGGLGFAIFDPIYRDGVLEGFFNAVFRIEPILEEYLSPSIIRRYGVALEGGGQEVWMQGLSRAELGAPVGLVAVGQRRWKLHLRPTKFLIAERLTYLPFGLGLFGFALGPIIALLLLRQQRDAAEREELLRHLQRVQKLETIGTLAAGFAHDFNNLLTPIICYSQLLRDARLEGDNVEFVSQIERSAEKAQGLVRQILAFSRGSRDAEPYLVRFDEVIRSALELVRASHPKVAIDLNLEVDGTVLGVATALEQVMLNLCMNACYAMRKLDGARLEVTLSRLEGLREGSLSQLPNGPILHLAVKDQGEGMSEKTQAKIFDPFYTTKPVGAGTGLGLSMVHGIVRDLRGVVAVESEIDKGSTLHVYLPESAKQLPNPTPIIPPSQVGAKILVVDDEPTILGLLQRVLEGEGYSVRTLSSSRAALALIEAEAVDLLITDFTMPELNGLELCERVRKARAKLPIILITGLGAVVPRDELAEQGVREILVKPFALDEILAAVRRQLQLSRPSE